MTCDVSPVAMFSFLSDLYFYAFSSPSISYQILIKYFYADGSISADYSHLARLELPRELYQFAGTSLGSLAHRERLL